MKRLLFILFIALPFIGFSQSFVFCPEIKTETRQGLNDVQLSIVFKDSRRFDKKLKEKCTKTEIFNEFVSCVNRTYPSAKITLLDENSFNTDPLKENITIKIDLQKYDATFYTGMYIANTKFEVTIFDFRKGENIVVDTISGEGRQFNALGLKSGKIASNSSFKEAFNQFVLVIEKLSQSEKKKVIVVTPFVNENVKSKADRLRELKQLLDEKILTQEDFEKEKKKILDE